MIEEKIRDLRNKLNNAMKVERSYDEIFTISLELDNLILQYYRNNEDTCWKSY